MKHSVFISSLLVCWLFGVGGCTTTVVTPLPPPAPFLPPYLKVPHPAGYDLGDLRAIFQEKDAPTAESLKDCDADYMKLRTLTVSEEEREVGARELIKQDPVRLHWCFFSKLLAIEDTIVSPKSFIDERQKKVLETYLFLVPISKAFMAEYKDSRYYRWSIRYYRRISETVFFKRVEISAPVTAELVEAATPNGFPKEERPSRAVLDRYGLGLRQPATLESPAVAPSPNPAPSSEILAALPSGIPGLDVPPPDSAAPLITPEPSPSVAPSPGPSPEPSIAAPATPPTSAPSSPAQ
ncbi:hypothetical protein WDW86_06960 [Bdellovibrionota bacterium FG-2]